MGMTHTRTYKIIDHFKSGKMVMVKHCSEAYYSEVVEIRDLLWCLQYTLKNSHTYTFRLINKKGRRG